MPWYLACGGGQVGAKGRQDSWNLPLPHCPHTPRQPLAQPGDRDGGTSVGWVLGSHKDLVCSSDLEEAGLSGGWPSLPGSQTLAAATRFCSLAASLPPALPLEELQLGTRGGGRARLWRARGPVLTGIQWQPWTWRPAGHHLAQRAGGLHPVGFQKG